MTEGRIAERVTQWLERATSAREACRRSAMEGRVFEGARSAFDSVKFALLAAAEAHGIAAIEGESLLALAESLSKATQFGCIPCRFSSLLVLGQDLRSAGYPPDRVRRMLPKALEVSENLAHLALGRVPEASRQD